MKIKELSASHYDKVAEVIYQDYMDRKLSSDRMDKLRIWNEVERQVAMRPKPLAHNDPDADWLPNTELPLQSTALEVLQADARQLTFPRDNKWYLAHANLTKEYLQKFNERRKKSPLVDGGPTAVDMRFSEFNEMVKGVMDFNHVAFDARQALDALDINALKFGTYGAKVVKAIQPDYNGIYSFKPFTGAAIVPINTKNLYLDNRKDQMTLEGMGIQQSPIREFWRKPEALKVAAKNDDSFINLKKLDENGEEGSVLDFHNFVHILEFEGDVVVPTSRETIVVKDVTLWVAINHGSPFVIRVRKNEYGFRSLITGTYIKDASNSMYGTSPLMKGQPIQELATDLTNQMATSVALSARPPIFWDANDMDLQRDGGPRLFPAASTPVENPATILNKQTSWPIGEIQAALALALQQYEDLTGVTAPRRGAAAKSHTTAFAAEVEMNRGLTRTDDYVQDKEKHFLRPVLQMEYKILTDVLEKTSVYIKEYDDYITVSKEDLPEQVMFEVVGSSGPMNERQKAERKLMALQQASAYDQARMAKGQPPIFNDEAAMKEILDVFESPERFLNSGTAGNAELPQQQATGVQGIGGNQNGGGTNIAPLPTR